MRDSCSFKIDINRDEKHSWEVEFENLTDNVVVSMDFYSFDSAYCYLINKLLYDMRNVK